MDFGFADFATANAFRKFAQLSQFSTIKSKLLLDATDLENRAHRSYKSLFDSGSGLMYPKDRAGNFRPHITPIEWGKGYTEGNAYHHSYIPFAIKELTALHNNGKTSFSNANSAGLSLRGVFRKTDNKKIADGDMGSIGRAPNDNILLQRLHDMLTMTGDFRPGSYGGEIHEMRGKCLMFL